jgi:hypothetical protein
VAGRVHRPDRIDARQGEPEVSIGARRDRRRLTTDQLRRELGNPHGKQRSRFQAFNLRRELGRYREVFIWWGEGLHPSKEGVPVFDTDSGRIAILDCFDTNFDEVWQEVERKGAEMVLWPSGYGGGLPLNGYAMIHNYYVVSAGWGNVIDILGNNIDPVEKPRPGQFIATIDLDRTLVHKDFNKEKMDRLLKERAGEVGLDTLKMEAWWMLRALKPGVRVRELCKTYQLETLREYRHRSREAINDARARGKRI